MCFVILIYKIYFLWLVLSKNLRKYQKQQLFFIPVILLCSNTLECANLNFLMTCAQFTVNFNRNFTKVLTLFKNKLKQGVVPREQLETEFNLNN